MAVRNPTAFTLWFDEEAMLPRDNIVETQPDLVITGQQEIRDRNQRVCGATFWPIRTALTGAWAAGMEVMRFHIEAPDLCGSGGGTVRIRVSARVAVDNTFTGEIRYRSLVNGDSDARTFTNTTPAWLAFDTSTWIGDGAQEDLQVDLRINAGDGVNNRAYIFGIYADMVHQ